MNYSKTALSKISNSIFFISSIFILSFIWINFYIKNMQKSIIISIIITLATCICIYPIKKYLYNKKFRTHQQNFSIDYLKTQLLFGNDNEIISILCKAFLLDNLEPISKNHYKTDNEDIFFFFSNHTISEQDIVHIYKNKTSQIIKVFCISSSLVPTSNNIQIQFINAMEIYKQLELSQYKIDFNITFSNKSKPTKKEILNTIFNANKSKNYFLFGLFIIFTSLFSPYQTYYIIVGSILILTSLFAKFNKKFN